MWGPTRGIVGALRGAAWLRERIERGRAFLPEGTCDRHARQPPESVVFLVGRAGGRMMSGEMAGGRARCVRSRGDEPMTTRDAAAEERRA